MTASNVLKFMKEKEVEFVEYPKVKHFSLLDLFNSSDDSKFKEFDELKSRLDRVLNSNSESGIRVETSKPAFPTPMSSEVPFDGGQPMNTKKEVPVAVTAENEDDDESLSYFQKLASEE